MSRVIACRAKGDYALWIRYADGLEGSVYLGNLLELGAFAAWRDLETFMGARPGADGTTIEWPRGGVRLDAAVLRADLAARGALSTPLDRLQTSAHQLIDHDRRGRDKSNKKAATVAAGTLAPLIERLVGCRQLLEHATTELTEKSARALGAHKRYAGEPTKIASAIALEESSKLSRALEDLRWLRVNLTQILVVIEELVEGRPRHG